ncbi:MAG: hypothetical protein ACR2IS_20030 [Nitrososphaeraceae archaeon]
MLERFSTSGSIFLKLYGIKQYLQTKKISIFLRLYGIKQYLQTKKIRGI